MHADGKSTLASVSKWNSGKVNLGKLEHLTNNYTGFGVASQNNPDILSGQRAHGGGGGGGVGMLWKTSHTSLFSNL